MTDNDTETETASDLFDRDEQPAHIIDVGESRSERTPAHIFVGGASGSGRTTGFTEDLPHWPEDDEGDSE